MEAGNAKLLVIDHETVLRSLLVNVLKTDFQVWFCDNCLMGLQILSEGYTPDIIILEYNSPKLNGLQFLKEIRGSGYFKDLSIVVQTNTSGVSIANACSDYSVDLIVSKPYDPIWLKNRVTEIIRGKNNSAYPLITNRQAS